jgi:hypothetical protein
VAVSALHTAIRAWAKGLYPTEAGAELLIRSGWADRLNGGGWVDWSDDETTAFPKVGDYLRNTGYMSGGERRQIRLIASFLSQEQGLYPAEGDAAPNLRTVLGEDLPGVDRSFIRLVQSAVGHAAGLHESGGNPLPWP